MTKTPENIITIYPPTQSNGGPSEDSEAYDITEPTQLKIIGSLNSGALPVRVLDTDGVASEQVYYFHQPEPKPPKP
jgi:hypothetical protein